MIEKEFLETLKRSLEKQTIVFEVMIEELPRERSIFRRYLNKVLEQSHTILNHTQRRLTTLSDELKKNNHHKSVSDNLYADKWPEKKVKND